MLLRASRDGSLLHIAVAGLRLLRGRDRRMAVLLSVLIALVEVLQVVAVILVLPLIGLIVEPSLLGSFDILQRLHKMLGSLPVGRFVVLLSAAALLFNTVGQISSFLTHSAIELFTHRIQTQLARELMAESIDAPYPWFLERNAAALVRLFHNDIAMWGRDFIGNLLRILASALTILAGVVMVLGVAPLGGFGMLAVVALVAYGVLRLVRPHLVRWTNIKRQAAEKTMVMETQIFSGVKDIKVSGSQGYFGELFGLAYGLMSRASARGVIFGQLPTSVLLLLGQTGLLLVALALWFSGSRGGELASQMMLIALVTYRVVPAVTQLSRLITLLVNVVPWVRGILELRASVAQARRSQPKAVGSRTMPAGWSEICFKGVGFAYGANDRLVLQDLSLSLERGKVYGLIGPSGAGKSTLVDLVLGLLQPTAGQILVDDVPLTEIDLRQWRRQIGYVPQTPYFTDATIRANVAFGVPADEVDEERVRRSVELAGLREFVAGLPFGLDTLSGDKAVKISGGERQRIAIARALYRQADLLVLDEATSALDPANQQLILRTIEGLRGRLTTLIVSHHMSAVSCSDCVFLLDEGRLVATGSLDTVVLAHPSFSGSFGKHT